MSRCLHRREILAGGLALAAAGASADDGVVRVTIKTPKGQITVDLYAAKAPITVKNFLRYVDAKLLDRSSFYRVSHVPNAPDHGLVEGGLRGDRKKVFKPIAHESTAKTGLTHKDGVVSMARRGPGTATADFFIVVGDQPGFDADPSGQGDKDGFAAFGQVTSGMDVVQAIFEQKVSATAGVGAMKGEMLSPPVPILTVRRA
ncbi:MAG TPA: peptidylprolyl isomerase [Caulobacteraceae bacterium]|jgi:peptidyl-prolyl cis-trans isomerase A (cyclophilin A)